MAKPELRAEEILAGPKTGMAAIASLVVGIIGLGAAAAMGLGGSGEPARFYFSYLIAFCFFMSLALGSLFFVFIQHLSSAGWSVVVRRFAEVVATNVVPMVLLFIPIYLGRHEIFYWLDPQVAATDPLVKTKVAFLNDGFWTIRAIVYFVIWGVLAWIFLGRSLKQDRTGDFRITMGLKRLSAPTAIIFAVSLTFFAFDMLMSLDPHWFSTIFGVYYFAGSALCGFAVLVVMAHIAQRSGKLKDIVTADHYMDLGKYLFAFTIFWTYIAFSQYMLYWYANIPEETAWFLRRQTGQWEGISWFLLIGHFIIPFLALISRYPKRRPNLLIWPALWILAMHYYDVFYLAMPELPAPAGQPGVVPFGLVDVLCVIGVGGFFTAFTLFGLRNRALIPRQDPRLNESLAFQNVGG